MDRVVSEREMREKLKKEKEEVNSLVHLRGRTPPTDVVCFCSAA